MSKIEKKLFKQIADAFRYHETFIVTAHIRADGDAIAAVCYVSETLRKLGKRVWPVIADPFPDPRYDFLPGFGQILSTHVDLPPDSIQVAIVLDSPSLERLGDAGKWVQMCPTIICIDHHPKNENFALLNLIDVHASSTCEILAQLSAFMPIELAPDLANTLYAGILFDTGNFRFSNTSGNTLRIAAGLIDSGANPEYTSHQLFHKTNILRVRTLAQVLQSIELLDGGKIAVSHLPYAFFANQLGIDRELEGFSNLALSIDGVQISIFMRELEPMNFKISLRAIDNWDVASVAEKFGGGGHRKASGCKIHGEYMNIVTQLIQHIHQFNPAFT
ncbi:MAG: bifunctional oligoribonuclease/PAP phosphatase NrnA [bacterium]